MMLTPILIAAGFGFAVAIFAMGLTSLRPTTESRARGRLASMAARPDIYVRDESVLRDERTSSIGAVDNLLRGRAWTQQIRHQLDRAGVPLKVAEYASLRVLSILVGFAVGRIIADAVGGSSTVSLAFMVLGVVVGVFTPPLLVNRRIAKRRSAIEQQLVELCELMASMLQSGYGYMQALSSTTRELEAPLGEELQRMLDKVRLGGDVDDALDELNERLGSKDFDMIVSAIAVQRKSGGNLSQILTGVAETIRDRQSFAREVSALTARERYSAVIVASFPLILIALLCLLSGEVYLRLFTQTAGQVMLGIALFLDFIGYLVIRGVTKLEV